MQRLNVNSFEGKDKEEVLKNALEKLNASKDEVFINEKEEVTGSILKKKKYKIDIVLKEDIIDFIKSYLKEVTSLMGISSEFEIQKREKFIKINMISDNNAILIGKSGRTMLALQTILRQTIQTQTGCKVNIILDTNDYKEKQQKNIERLAIKLAREVRKTKIEVKMDRMNSFERRLVHNKLSDFKGVTTISEGEEPNRCVVIKPVEGD